MKRFAILFTCLAVLTFHQAAAQGMDDGLINAVAYKPLPANKQINVRAMDNSDANMILVKEFETVLRDNGYTVSANAPIILTFETRDELGAWSDHGKRTLIELSARGGDEGGEDAKARFNVFDSKKGGILNKGRGGTSITTPSQYRMDVTIEDGSSGRRLWQAWAVANLVHTDGPALTKKMVPVIVNKIGQKVVRQPFKVR